MNELIIGEKSSKSHIDKLAELPFGLSDRPRRGDDAGLVGYLPLRGSLPMLVVNLGRLLPVPLAFTEALSPAATIWTRRQLSESLKDICSSTDAL